MKPGLESKRSSWHDAAIRASNGATAKNKSFMNHLCCPLKGQPYRKYVFVRIIVVPSIGSWSWPLLQAVEWNPEFQNSHSNRNGKLASIAVHPRCMMHDRMHDRDQTTYSFRGVFHILWKAETSSSYIEVLLSPWCGIKKSSKGSESATVSETKGYKEIWRSRVHSPSFEIHFSK
jgi:hypothetical protein